MTPSNDQMDINQISPEPTQSDLKSDVQTAEKNQEFNKAFTQMLGLTLQTTLQQISEYSELIKTAKTGAKRDLYRRKIKSATKRLSRLLPNES